MRRTISRSSASLWLCGSDVFLRADLPLGGMSAEPEEPAHARYAPERRHPRPSDWWPRPPLLMPPRLPPRSKHHPVVSLWAPF